MAGLVLDDLKINDVVTKAAAMGGYANATELADYLVTKQIPFREAHHIVGEVVVYALTQKKPLEALSITEFQQFAPAISEDVYPILALDSIFAKRQALGGVSAEQIEFALTQAEQRLAL
jgi:argininosuccinate lyase